MKRVVRLFAAAVLLAPLLVLLLAPCGVVPWFFFGEAIEECLQQGPFDSVAWKAGEDADRIRMVDDLLRRHPLVGMSKEKVRKLLGEPTKTGHFANYDAVYWLGPERGFISIDSEWLVLRFEHGRVVEASVVKD